MTPGGPQIDTQALESLACDAEHHCITCGDDGVPMRVLEPASADGLALCAGGDGEQATVEVTLVEPVAVGDELLVHAGVALTRLEGAGA